MVEPGQRSVTLGGRGFFAVGCAGAALAGAVEMSGTMVVPDYPSLPNR